MGSSRRFSQLDVFTSVPLLGNPLAELMPAGAWVRHLARLLCDTAHGASVDLAIERGAGAGCDASAVAGGVDLAPAIPDRLTTPAANQKSWISLGGGKVRVFFDPANPNLKAGVYTLTVRASFAAAPNPLSPALAVASASPPNCQPSSTNFFKPARPCAPSPPTYCGGIVPFA